MIVCTLHCICGDHNNLLAWSSVVLLYHVTKRILCTNATILNALHRFMSIDKPSSVLYHISHVPFAYFVDTTLVKIAVLCGLMSLTWIRCCTSDRNSSQNTYT